jgi:hypothetical protein
MDQRSFRTPLRDIEERIGTAMLCVSATGTIDFAWPCGCAGRYDYDAGDRWDPCWAHAPLAHELESARLSAIWETPFLRL